MKIPIEEFYRKMYYELEDQIFDSNFWSEGDCVRRFEEEFGAYVGAGAKAMSSGGAALYAILEYIDIRDCDVIVPANTFWADVRAVQMAGGRVIYADSNKEDLCLSLEDLKRKRTKNTRAVIVVHIGGHLAFQINEIGAYCKENNIFLIEDCAHAHGASWNGQMAGTFGFAGAYSFYATKTMPLGEGGMIVSRDQAFLEWVEMFRNYGKKVVNGKVTYPLLNGWNFRMTEFSAALGIVQIKRLPMILEWKRQLAAKYDSIFENRVRFPEGMLSGYYKYIVFGYCLKEETGKVFSETDFGCEIEKQEAEIPNSRLVAALHHCVPIYYGYEYADKTAEELRVILLGRE